MDTFLLLFIAFVVSFVSTFLSSISGGGASIIAVPVWLSLGFSFPLANAIQQICSTFWVIPAARNYLRKTKIDYDFLLGFAIVGIIGVAFGIYVILSLPQRLLEIIIGCVIILLVVYVFLKNDFGVVPIKVTRIMRRILAYPFALYMGFYESIFGAGNGLFFSAVSIYTRGFVLKEALGYYYAIAFPWCLLSSIILIYKGYFDVPVMIIAVIGSILGGYFGSKYAAHKGNRFIKIAFCVIGFVLGLKLLIGF